MKTVRGFIWGGSKITADSDCSHEIKRCLLLGRKVMTNLDSILENRDITLPTKIRLVRAMVFPVVMYGCESWTIKKAEHGRIDAFGLWCWRRLLRVPWTARRSNQSILKEISSEYSLERQMLKLKLQYFGHLLRRTDLFEKTLMLGKIESRGEGDNRGWDGWMASSTQRTWVWVNSRSGDGQGDLVCCSPWGHKESDTTEWLNWTEGLDGGCDSLYLMWLIWEDFSEELAFARGLMKWEECPGRPLDKEPPRHREWSVSEFWVGMLQAMWLNLEKERHGRWG